MPHFTGIMLKYYAVVMCDVATLEGNHAVVSSHIYMTTCLLVASPMNFKGTICFEDAPMKLPEGDGVSDGTTSAQEHAFITLPKKDPQNEWACTCLAIALQPSFEAALTAIFTKRPPSPTLLQLTSTTAPTNASQGKEFVVSVGTWKGVIMLITNPW